MSDVAIKVENLSKKYYLGASANGNLRDTLAHGWNKLWGTATPNAGNKEFWALNDVSFEVKKGEVIGIIGRNGAGKSTLLKILSRITEPTSGRIELDGRVASLLEVGTGFHPELTGRENIFLNGSLLGMTRKEIKKKFDEIVDFSGVEEFIDTPVKKYSSGMYVRLAFAVAAHLEPEILLVDEVLAVGDFEFQKKCLGKMDEVAKGGRTVLFVSHNLRSIQNICQKTMLLKNGNLAFVGTSDQAIDAYLESDHMTSPLADNLQIHPEFVSEVELRVNDSTLDHIFIGSNFMLIVWFSFKAQKNFKTGVEVRIYDAQESYLGIFSPGHFDQTRSVLDCQIGKSYSISCEINLPELHTGTYYLMVSLSLSGIATYAETTQPLQLQVYEKLTVTGVPFQQGLNGFFTLAGSINFRMQ